MAADLALSPSRSPSTRFSKFRKRQSSKDDNASSPSLASSAADEKLEGGTEARASTESFAAKVGDKLADKLRPHVKRYGEDDRSPSDTSKRLSRLIPDKIKRRKPSAGPAQDTDGDEDTKSSGLLATLSRQSLHRAESVRSSLMTEDSEQEEGISPTEQVRSSTSPHESHKGYLTVTSPHVTPHTDKDTVASAPTDDLTALSTASSAAQSDTVTSASKATSPSAAGSDRRSSQAGKIKSSLSFKRKGSLDTGSSKGDSSPVAHVTSSPDLPILKTPTKPRPVSEIVPSNRVAATPQHTPRSPRPISLDISRVVATEDDASVTAPETLVTPPTPTRATAGEKEPAKSSGTRSRRGSFNLSNLANLAPTKSAVSPLNPSAEDAKKTADSVASPPPSNFLSSVLNVASTAAVSWSNPFQSTSNQKGKLNPSDKSQEKTGTGEAANTPQGKLHDVTSLSRSRLEGPRSPSMVSSANTAPDGSSKTNVADSQPAKVTDEASTNGNNTVPEKSLQTALTQAQGLGRPRSIASQNSFTDHSPSRPPTELVADIKRSGSIRSRLSDRRRNRKRGSSVGTTNTFAPSLSQVNSLVQAPSIAPRTTGYAVANVKRNKDFHQLFRSVPEDDYLIEDYSAALQRDILLHGRFYVSEGHLCFSSNILGWVTNLVIAFDEILSVEKKNTAMIFPNAIVIETAHAKNTFASFVTRDSTFDLVIGIWRTAHPNLRVSPIGVYLDRTNAPEPPQKGESTGSDESGDNSDDVYDEDAEGEDDLVSVTEHGANGSVAGSDIGDPASIARKSSAHAMGSSTPSSGSALRNVEGNESGASGVATTADFPGPATHEPTDCGDAATHYDRPLIDTTIPAPLGKIYSLYFGPQSGAFMKKWLVDAQKSRELSYDDDKIGLDDNHKTITYSYIKPLNAPVGPKQTKCIVTCTLQNFDLNSSVTVDCSTQTPDVPSGNIFTTKTRYCLMWGPGNSTRMVANCTIEWTGKSWLKGPIEKGANDGQTQYVKDLVASLRAAVSRPNGTRSGAVTKSSKRVRRGTGKGEEIDTVAIEAQPKQAQEDWGLFDPLRPSLGPLVSFLRPFFTPQMVISVLFILLVQSWFFNFTPRHRPTVDGVTISSSGAERMAAYEALWAREEAELWDWLEDRVGLDQGLLASSSGGRADAPGKVKDGKAAPKRAVHQKMRAREVEEALRITEEKLKVLKQARSL